jgi:hypothetical protein
VDAVVSGGEATDLHHDTVLIQTHSIHNLTLIF